MNGEGGLNVNAFRKTRLRFQKTQAGLEGEGGKLLFEKKLSLRDQCA